VLLLGCHSLLWALDPLRQVPEGGVTLICPSPDDRQRLAAQIDLLEPERQPQLLDGVEALPSDQVFDWIGGRLGTVDLLETDWTELAQTLTGHADSNASLRLLISCAGCGPAGALSASHTAETSLSQLVEQEQSWLQQLQIRTQPLEEQGWSLNTDQWDEVLTLPGGKSLAERWLANDSDYRRMLGSIQPEPLQLLRTTLEGLGSERLRLPMRHQLLAGKRSQPTTEHRVLSPQTERA
jgi:putative ATPase